MAKLTFTLAMEGLEENTLLVREYEGQESLSDSLIKDKSKNRTPCYGFRYQLSLASRRMDLTAEELVDKSAELTVLRDDKVVQRVNGIVRHFEKGDTGHHHTFYGLTLVPALERLSLRHNSRTFLSKNGQLKNAKTIITQLITDMGIPAPVFTLQTAEPAEREFCVQYRETDSEFIHRLAAEEGWVYYFEHTEGQHTLHFVDQSISLPSHEIPIPYKALASGVAKNAHISTLSEHKQSLPSEALLKDYSFKNPSYQNLHKKDGTNLTYQLPIYEHFDSPGRFKEDAVGTRFTKIRLEFLRREAHVVTGESDATSIIAGRKIHIANHMDTAISDQEWLPVQVNHRGTQPQVLEEEGLDGETTYSNHFTLIPASTNWQATPQTKPSVDGSSMATVVGPEGEEIFCDAYGRVKIQFPWDRYGKSDEFSSCWVQVSQSWTGSQYGMIAIPRIGTDVIVTFLNGDPDQPVITGRTFNAKRIPPYMIPEHKTKTIWRSRTHQGAGFNEISFEDQTGSEQVYFRAQNDMLVKVLNDQTTNVGNDHTLNVENDSLTNIKMNQHITVDGECRLTITKNKHSVSEAVYQRKVTQTNRLEAKQEIHLKSGVKAVIESNQAITLKAGGNFITVDADGVHLMSPNVTLNEGGEAAPIKPFTAELAEVPTTGILETDAANEAGVTSEKSSSTYQPTTAQSSGSASVSGGTAATSSAGAAGSASSSEATTEETATDGETTKSEQNDEMDTKWLTVPKGQLTFDAEGSDEEGGTYFSRIPHLPNNNGIVIGNSGITFGRGLDLGQRTAAQIEEHFANAAEHCQPISDALLNWLKGGAGKTQQAAYDYLQTLDAKVPVTEQQITRKMQHFLFLDVYAYYEEDAKHLTTKADVREKYIDSAELDWDALSDKVKAVIIDLRYVGHYTGLDDARGNTREVIVPAIYKDLQEGFSGIESYFYEVMVNTEIWRNRFNVDPNRYETRSKELE